jgi:DNA-binding NarL/FixJ family response regulator
MIGTSNPVIGSAGLSTRRANVLLVDDHPIVRQGLAQLINDEKDLHVSAEAGTAREAMEAIDKERPDIAIVDISLEDRSGVELIKDIQNRFPEVPCLALSMYDESMYAIRVLRAGGRGYVMKQEVPKKVLIAIRRVLGGHIYVSENMATRLLDQLVTNAPPGEQPALGNLTDREMEVLTMIGRGIGTREIADRLYLSVKTIEGHRERIKEKLKLKTGAELVRYAVQYTLDRGGNRS